MAKATYADQRDIFNPEEFNWPVHAIGMGGIGSAYILHLVKLGLKTELHLWDPDVVEPHNIPCQLLYRPTDIGRPKVEVVKEILDQYKEDDCEIVAHAEVVTASTPLEGLVISGVDSMKSRYAIWEAIEYNPDVALYIDGRMGGEQVTLFTLNPSDVNAVEYYTSEALFPDEQGSELPCAARTVIHPPAVLAGRIIAEVTRFARDMSCHTMIDEHIRETQLTVASLSSEGVLNTQYTTS